MECQKNSVISVCEVTELSGTEAETNQQEIMKLRRKEKGEKF